MVKTDFPNLVFIKTLLWDKNETFRVRLGIAIGFLRRYILIIKK